jgi:hypothetical protein
MRYFILVFLTVSCYANELNTYNWEHDGVNARVSQFLKFENTPQKMYAMLNIEFSAHKRCADTLVSVITTKGRKLGVKKTHDFKSADNNDNKLRFYIGGKEFDYNAEKTIRVIYDNGVELGTLSPKGLTDALRDNQGQLEVKIGEETLVKFDKTVGMLQVLNKAKNTCLISLK